MTKKIPISFNNEELQTIYELGELLGYGGVKEYGSVPKTVKLSITLAKLYVEQLAKSIPSLDHDKLVKVLSSVIQIKKEEKKRIFNETPRNEAIKYNL